MNMNEPASVTDRLRSAKTSLAREDYVAARDQYEILAGLGSKEALLALGYIYERGGNGVTKDYSTARYWLERSWSEGRGPVRIFV